jgi:Secretion system C-terminal sorting domain
VKSTIKYLTLLMLFCIFKDVKLLAQCPNDNFFWTTLNTIGAGDVQSDFFYAGEYATTDVCQGATYTFSTCGSSGFNSQLTLLNDATFAFIAYNDDACGTKSSITWTATFTGTVRILVDKFNCSNISGNTVLLSVTQVSACPSPTNNLCANAITVSCGQTIIGYTNSASAEANAAGCGTSASPSVWYKFTGTGNNINVSLQGSTYDTEMAIITGPCNAMTCISWNDDYCLGASELSFMSVLGTTYYIRISGPTAFDYGNYILKLTCSVLPPPPFSNPSEDCSAMLPLCADQQLAGNSTGPGVSVDLNAGNEGCLSGENQSSWYYFQPTTTGTIAFTLTPDCYTDDYDWAIWGPYVNRPCPPTGAPLRCSYSAVDGPTGLNSTALDLTEGAAGDGWVNELTITPANINMYYILLIDNYLASNIPFLFDLQTVGVILSCQTLLPVELTSFTGESAGPKNKLIWTTQTELNNDHFEVEKSTNNSNFDRIGTAVGAGNSQSVRHYNFTDNEGWNELSYYRLKQVDYNGAFAYSEVISIEKNIAFTVSPNPSSGKVNLDYKMNSGSRAVVRIFDMKGREVSNNPLTGTGRQEFDFSRWSQGVYRLIVQSDNMEILFSETLLVDAW